MIDGVRVRSLTVRGSGSEGAPLGGVAIRVKRRSAAPLQTLAGRCGSCRGGRGALASRSGVRSFGRNDDRRVATHGGSFSAGSEGRGVGPPSKAAPCTERQSTPARSRHARSPGSGRKAACDKRIAARERQAKSWQAKSSQAATGRRRAASSPSSGNLAAGHAAAAAWCPAAPQSAAGTSGCPARGSAGPLWRLASWRTKPGWRSAPRLRAPGLCRDRPGDQQLPFADRAPLG